MLSGLLVIILNFMILNCLPFWAMAFLWLLVFVHHLTSSWIRCQFNSLISNFYICIYIICLISGHGCQLIHLWLLASFSWFFLVHWSSLHLHARGTSDIFFHGYLYLSWINQCCMSRYSACFINVIVFTWDIVINICNVIRF